MLEEEGEKVSKPEATVPDSVYPFVGSKPLNISNEKSGHFPAVLLTIKLDIMEETSGLCLWQPNWILLITQQYMSSRVCSDKTEYCQ